MSVRSEGRSRPGPGRLPRPPWSLVVLGALYAAVVAVQIAVIGNREAQTPSFGVSFLMLDILGVVFSARAARCRRLEPAQRRPWAFMVPALLMHTVSTVGFAVA
ncbi:MAG TPA: hypothetical protein VF657_01765, partial [Actinoplanes sp.]